MAQQGPRENPPTMGISTSVGTQACQFRAGELLGAELNQVIEVCLDIRDPVCNRICFRSMSLKINAGTQLYGSLKKNNCFTFANQANYGVHEKPEEH
ncbi:hypothetical protein APTSU1_000334000 [Apodemus speciosus]|uniref:Uncharacterized protein n=1 Tax=Apodemus speciosus TaxID=105296 RepID=A0ABQ0EMR2_APOSI